MNKKITRLLSYTFRSSFFICSVLFSLFSNNLSAQVASRTDGVNVYYYANLHDAFEEAGGTSINNPDEIILLADLVLDEPLIVEDGKHIALVPGNGSRTITRGINNIEFPVIWVNGESASLSLGKPGLEYELVIDGGYLSSSAIEAHCPIAAVSGPDAKLIMYDKVILQNNCNSGVPPGTTVYQLGGCVHIRTAGNLEDRKAEFIMKGGTIQGNVNNIQTDLPAGGGVYISGFGIFTMEGGSIMNNTALLCGGGFHGGGRATFRKTGGIIYGANAPVGLRNSVINGVGSPKIFGHAVSIATGESPFYQFRDDTIGENDNLTSVGSADSIVVFGQGEKWSKPVSVFRRNLIIGIVSALVLVVVIFVIVKKRTKNKVLQTASAEQLTEISVDLSGLNLSPREQEIFKLLLTDMSFKDIAETLNLSNSGVTFHSQNIYRKLGIQSRTELLVKYKQIRNEK